MLPNQCLKCAKNKKVPTHTSCRVCTTTDFDETILCDLNRSVQEEADEFECHAFQPTLEVVGSTKQIDPEENGRQDSHNTLADQLAILKLMNSDKIQYQKAWTLQQLEKDPGATIVRLKFHYAWNVKGRRCLFAKSEEYFNQIHDAFSKFSLPSVQRTQLLWLAPDHVHVYCEADGERSAEEILIDLKELFEQELFKQFPDLAEELNQYETFWDEEYFVETIG